MQHSAYWNRMSPDCVCVCGNFKTNMITIDTRYKTKTVEWFVHACRRIKIDISTDVGVWNNIIGVLVIKKCRAKPRKSANLCGGCSQACKVSNRLGSRCMCRLQMCEIDRRNPSTHKKPECYYKYIIYAEGAVHLHINSIRKVQCVMWLKACVWHRKRHPRVPRTHASSGTSHTCMQSLLKYMQMSRNMHAPWTFVHERM